MTAQNNHLDVLRRFNAWRTGEDDGTMDEAGIVPGEITQALNAAIAEIERLRNALNYVLEDEPNLTPRATSGCRAVVRRALGDRL